MILAGTAVLALSRIVKLPGVVAYLVAGFIIGPLLGLTSDSHQMDWLLETGISLMLFLVGLEMSPELVKHLKGKPLLTGVIQVVFMTFCGSAFLMAFGNPPKTAVIGGFALALSSTIVVLKILQDQKDTKAAFGQLALAILLTQDFFVILGLTMLEAIHKIESPSFINISLPIFKTLLSFVLMFGICYGFLKAVLIPLFRWQRATPDLLLVVSLAWCFGVVTLAHLFHLSAESGAFMAGLLMARIRQSEDLRRRVHPLMQLFIAVFFVNLAARMEISTIMSDPMTFVAITLFVLVLKPILMFGLFRMIRWRKLLAARTAILLGQISEFSLIFLSAANKNGLVDDKMANLFLALALVSFPINIIFYQFLYKPALKEAEENDPDPTKSKSVVIIGMNTLGKLLVNRMIEDGCNVTAVDTDPNKLKGFDCHTILGSTDYQETLEDINLSEAHLVISALRIEEANELIAYWCKRKGVPCCIHGVDMNNLDTLLDQNVNYLILPKVDGIKQQVEELRKEGLLKS